MNKDSDIDFEIINDEIEEKIDEQLKDLEEVKVEAKEIGNPKKLVDSISQIVWSSLFCKSLVKPAKISSSKTII